MKIDEQLKKNLIADVENICDLNLSIDTKIALMRAFEITIGCANISSILPAESLNEGKEKKKICTAHYVGCNNAYIVRVGCVKDGDCQYQLID